jgi:hypothetical protein
MSKLPRYFAFFIFVLGFGVFMGCSDSNRFDANNQLGIEPFDSYAGILGEDFDRLQASGMGIDSANGVFSIGWREFLNPMVSDTVTHGHAFAIAFDEISSQIPRPFKSGLDMGSVFINYQSNHLELQKIVNPHGGVLYSLFPRFNTGNELEFIPNEIYEFEITGSSSFGPINIPLTAPSALLDFTSHANGDVIDPNNDLNLTWSGGSASDPVAIHILPEIVFQPSGGVRVRQLPGGNYGNIGPHFHGGHGGRGPHPLPMPMPIHMGIFEVLPNNPGQYTVAAADIQNLLSNTNATGIICHVSQMNGTEVDHEGRILWAVMRNGDQLMLSIQ